LRDRADSRHFKPLGLHVATLILGFSDANKANSIRRSFHRTACVSMVIRQSRRGIFKITKLVNDSSPHQQRPDWVRDGSREIRNVWPKQPVSEYFSWIAHSRIQLHCRAVRKNRLFTQAVLVASRIEINDLLFPLRSRFLGDMRKRSGERIKLLLGPVLGPLSHSGKRYRRGNSARRPVLHRPIKTQLTLPEITSTPNQ